jgi:chemotaxis response regulator CheB
LAQRDAIGASAGGIEAFRRFFETMPGESGMAFVVVLHLSAERKSRDRPEIGGIETGTV